MLNNQIMRKFITYRSIERILQKKKNINSEMNWKESSIETHKQKMLN